MGELALSISSLAQKDRAVMSKPVSHLAHMSGLRVDDVYSRLIPELASADLDNALRFAEVGMDYAKVVDRNRLREECGENFIIALEMIINLVRDGLDSSEKYLKRKAMKMHAALIDESAEKARFVESILLESKLQMIAESKSGICKLEDEILEFEQTDDGGFELLEKFRAS